MSAKNHESGSSKFDSAIPTTGWARGSTEVLGQRRSRSTTGSTSDIDSLRNPGSRSRLSQLRLAETGITWDSDAVDWSLLKQSSVERVRARFRGSLPEYIWDAAALEGNPYTLPEVQTLLEGITVTGHRIADQDQILALNEGFNLVETLVGRGVFRLDKPTTDRVHAKVAVHEAIESGHFRGEGHVDGGGIVSIGELGTFRASAPGEGGANLRREFQDLMSYLAEDVEDPRERALAYFCAATRRQFYFDGNKRTSKLMMAGYLLANGYDAISISARRQLEFNQLLAPMFDNGDATEMMQFIIDSRPE
jgi:hypothetical protein